MSSFFGRARARSFVFVHAGTNFQADDEGSIPFTRSNIFNSLSDRQLS
jgi:hypothetical protein